MEYTYIGDFHNWKAIRRCKCRLCNTPILKGEHHLEYWVGNNCVKIHLHHFNQEIKDKVMVEIL
jgi:hypothetical protein